MSTRSPLRLSMIFKGPEVAYVFRITILALWIISGCLWAISCTTNFKYNDGAGSLISVSHGTLAYRGGVTSFGTIAYTLVSPERLSKGDRPEPVPVDLESVRQSHRFPAYRLSKKFDFFPSWGTNSFLKREPCGNYFSCRCLYPGSDTGPFWVQTFSLALGLPFLVFGLLTLVFWRKRISYALRNRKAPNQCRSCSYDLSFNSSRLCPECGTPIPEDQIQAIANATTRT